MIISAHEVAAARGGRAIFQGISLEARAGEVLGLLGPNGAGKTTLLRLLAGLDAPEAGAIRFDGRSAAALGRPWLGRALAYLPQNGSIHWPLKVEQVVALGRLPHRAGPVADGVVVTRAMAAADVAHLRGRTSGTLSGGERMRVLLARALAVEGRALLADEPVAALDPAHQIQAMELLRQVARQGTTVVVVLHDLTLAARFCDRLALLAGSSLRAAGAPAEVLTPSHMAAAFGVTVEAGWRDGEPYVVPWRRIAEVHS